MLKDIFEQRCGFKLVCGAGNEDVVEVERLVALYSLAGCQFFDVCAKPEVLLAAKRGLKKAGIEKDRYLCVSVGIDGDPHVAKAQINKDKCINCSKCAQVCIHEAIIQKDSFEVSEKRCLGCHKCVENCPNGAIEMISKVKDYKEVLPELIKIGIDCVEFHAISDNEKEVDEKWAQINEMFDGLLCISLDRSGLGDKKLKDRVLRMIQNRKPYSTIIQADGVAMSGCDDEYSTTLQAVATAQLFQNSKMPIYIMMSGGTNTKSTELAKLCGVYPHCIAVGSYARKIVKDFLKKEDLFENQEILEKALLVAKNLINVSLENMKID